MPVHVLSTKRYHQETDAIAEAAKSDKDQLSLTNPRDALHHGERAANN